MLTQTLRIERTWDGELALPEEISVVTFTIDGEQLVVTVDAPFHDDPPPSATPVSPKGGSTWRLWEHEVVELFLLGADRRYLELELGPHGHYLCLELHGVRNIIKRDLTIEYQAQIYKAQIYQAQIYRQRWSGRAVLSADLLPPKYSGVNAYSIHGSSERRYLAAFPVPGDTPDFHRLECFGSIDQLV